MARNLWVAGFAALVAVVASGQSCAQNAYITNAGDGTVSVISTATNATIGSPITVGTEPFGVAVAPDGSTVYAANLMSDNVSVISTATNTVISTITVGNAPQGVAVTPDGSTVYVANEDDSTVSVISTATNAVIDTITVETGVSGLAVTPDSSTVYVADVHGNTVSVISTATNTVTGTITVGSAPDGLAVTPDGSTVYVANGSGGTVSVISTATNTVTGTVTVGTEPLGVAVTPDGSTVYVANEAGGTVSVISTATNTVTGTITVGLDPVGVSVTPDGSTVYVANSVSDTVSVISTATNTIIGSPIPVGTQPGAFGQFIATPPPLSPTVTGVSPSSGPLTGGATVTITGSNLGGATSVLFGTVSAAIITNGATTITVTPPTGTAGTVNVTVTTTNGMSAISGADEYTYAVAVPTVTGLTPNAGVLAGGNTVTVSGTGFVSEETAVRFGGAPGTGVSVMSTTLLTVTAPTGSAGTVDVTVATAGGTSTAVPADRYTYEAVPTVTGLTPGAGPLAGGNTVTVNGTGFVSGATAVSFGGTPGTAVSVTSATSLTVTVPTGSAGPVDVTVTTAGGTSTTVPADQYIYEAVPTVTGLTPGAGVLAGGNAVTVSGTGFVSGATAVSFGGTPGTAVSVTSATSLTATVPIGTAGTVNVTVTTAGGTSTAVPADQYTYVAPPTVTGLTPSAGPLAGGNTVTVSGTGFASGATTVSFGGTPGTAVSVTNGSTLTVTVPIGTAGSVNVTVTTAGGTSTAVPADRYTYAAPPTVTAVNPSSGPLSGTGTVTITGTNLTAASAVKFGTVPATNIVVLSASQVTATAPAGSAVTVDVTVTTPGGISATGVADHFTYAPPPTVTAVSPSSGPLGGTGTVTITGTNLTAASAVKFGTVPATNIVVLSASQVTATAPAGSAGTVDVTVTTPGGISATGVADHFTYAPPPTVTAVSPSNGPIAGGTSVVITGSSMTGATAVTFGTIPAASFTVNNATQITAVSPAGAAAGPIDVTVTTVGGTSAVNAGDHFTFIGKSSVALTSSVNPSSFGQTVTLTAIVTASGGNPAGTVVFRDGSTVLFTGTLAAQITSFTTSALSVGQHAISASYGGGSIFTSASGSLLQTVDPVVTTPDQTYAYQSTLGTTGVAKPDNSHFDLPGAATVDSVNNHLFIADTGNQRVQVLDTGTLAVVATIGTPGAGGSDNAHLNAPKGVGFDPASGHVFVVDSGNDRIQLFDAKSFAYVATLGIAGTTGTDNAHFDAPSSVFVNGSTGQLYVADTGNQRVQIFDTATLAYVATLGSTGASGSDNLHFKAPMDAEFNSATHQILVADSGNSRVQLFDATSLAYDATLGDAGLGIASNEDLGSPVTAAYDPVTNLVLIADDSAGQRVQVFDALSYNYVLTIGTTGTTGTTGSAGSGENQFSTPAGIAIDAAHQRLFIGDQQNDRVQIFSIEPTVAFASVLPDSRSVELGHPATIFASVINAGTTPLQGCQVALPVTAPAGLSLSYQTTNPATNALIGTPDTPATIPANNGVQSFLVTLQGNEAFSAPGMALDVGCLGIGPAASETGVDTVDLTMSPTPVADIIALAATPTNNGIVEIPAGGANAFAIASTNVGVTSQIVVSVDTGAAALPLTATLCQSNPSTGACLATPAGSVTLNYAAQASPTFSVFLQAKDAIPFAPATSRVFLRFKDPSGGIHGSTSVAVETK